MSPLETLIGECAEQVLAAGLKCPLPLLKTKKALARVQAGERVYLCATDPGSMRDLTAYAVEAGHAIAFAAEQAEAFHFVFIKHGAQLPQ